MFADLFNVRLIRSSILMGASAFALGKGAWGA